LVGVWAFTGLTGAAAPSLRAALMASAALLATGTGRGRDALAALALSGAAMLAVDPGLISDLSFQLSVLATLGLITLQPRLAALVPAWPAWVREPLAATLAAELATAPLIAATFHQLSLVAPLANSLVAPVIPIATIGGAVGLATAALIPPLADGVGLLLTLLTGYLVRVILETAALPRATTPIGDISPAAVTLYAGLLLSWAIAPTPEGRSLVTAVRSAGARPLLAGLAAFLATGLVTWSGSVAAANPVLSLSVLDVGEGDALFLRSPGQRTVLIDGGPSPPDLMTQLGRRLGIAERTVSLALLSAADGERLPAAVAALERYPAEVVVGPPEGSTSALYARWRAAAAASRYVDGSQPTAVEVEPGVVLEVLPTPPLASPTRPAGPPQRTLVIRLVYGEVAVLIAPSLTADVAASLRAEGWSLAADALVVPRHGDAASVSPALLTAVSPALAVISVGARSRLGHPAPRTLEALAGVPIYRTDLQGTINLRSDGRRLWVAPDGG
jgi:competence protein ComEC